MDFQLTDQKGLVMTECERIVKEGIVPEDFLKEETRCDFFVDSTRKKIWAIVLDLLKEFDSVCKKNGLKYYLAFGSLIGAVRHKGFIPWDDDLDVLMFRDDYQKLLALSDSFHTPYFLQTPYTDKNAFFSFAKLRNDYTTYISKHMSYQGFHSGVWLDIFPLDNSILEKGEDIYNQVKELALENSTYMRMKYPFLSEADQERVRKWKGMDPLKVYEEINRLASSYNDIETEYVNCAICTVYSYKKFLFRKTSFDKTVYLVFENMNVPAPAGYHEVLSTTYGDYMKYPPVNERGTWHKDLIVDPDTPYTIRLKHA